MKPVHLASRALVASVGMLATEASTPKHVVLVHGIWDTSRTMRRMAHEMRAAGLKPLIVTLTPNDGRASLEVLASEMNRQIEHRLPAHASFSIVGFSMGGLVARSYLLQFGDPHRISNFVCIASPNRGTWTAWLDGSPGIREMRPGSKFLAKLDKDAARFSRTRWVTIRTPLDLIVVPANTAVLPWAHNISVPVLAHPLLVSDPRVIAAVIESVGGDVNRMSAAERRALRRAERLQRQTPDTPPLRKASPAKQ